MNHKEFSTVITWDLATYKEFSKGALFTMKSRVIIDMIAICYLIAYIFVIGLMKNNFGFFSVVVTLLLIWIVVKLVTRKGGIQYKRMISNNNGQPPRNRMTVTEDGFQAQNLDNENVNNFAFSRVLSIAETENLLIMMMEYRQGFIIDKRTLTGGTYDELVEFLFSSCTNLKKRKIYTGRGSKIRKIIILLLILVGLVFAFVQEATNDDYYEDVYGIPSGKMNDLSYEEIAQEMEILGIKDIPEETLDRLQNEWNQFSKEEQQYLNKATLLLTEIGIGTYDNITWTRTPTSENVYAFDMEFLNVESMYTEFLTGVSAIGGGDLDFTAIEEDLDEVDWENGTGSRFVKFEWKGSSCYLGAEMMNDWFDSSFADNLNIMIAARCDGKQLYFGSDGYQMVYVFYCDSEWAAEFEEVTGIPLSEKLDY